jgi:hypothetical protein
LSTAVPALALEIEIEIEIETPGPEMGKRMQTDP